MAKKSEEQKKEDIKSVEEKQETEKIDKKVADVSYYEAVGRRKEASCRVRLYVVNDTAVVVNGISLEKGSMVVNGRPIESYFPGEVAKKTYTEPFRTTNTLKRFVVSITVAGGGPGGQLGAALHGISRALEKVDKEKFRPILKKRGFLTRDSRKKQRRKAGFAGKARAKKQSPKR